MLPCAGQGALGIETRADADALIERVAALAHRSTQLAVAAERAVSRALGGSCSMPLAAHATWRGDDARAARGRRPSVAARGAAAARRRRAAGSATQRAAEALGTQAARALLAAGAAPYLAAAESLGATPAAD